MKDLLVVGAEGDPSRTSHAAMARRGVAFAALALLLLVSGGTCAEATGGVDPEWMHAEIGLQIETIANIRVIVIHLLLYKEDHGGHPPPTLDALREKPYELPRSYLWDGWGRPLWYYVNKSRFTILSFGKNGVPEGQQAEPGRFGPRGQLDLDIVWVDNWWAQTPSGIDNGAPWAGGESDER